MSNETTNAGIQSILQFESGSKAAPTAITGTNAITGVFSCFQVWDSATTIASITINGTAFTQYAALTLPQGFVVYGYITSITLGAGSGLAYAG